MDTDVKRPCFYAYLREPNDTIEWEVEELTRKRVKLLSSRYFDERNAHGYRHGKKWALESSGETATELRSVVAETTIHTIDVINHNISVLENQITIISDQIHSEMMKHLFQTLNEATASNGNTINAADYGGEISASFLAMLKKIEFGVDRYGRPSRPSLHVSPAQGKKILDSLHSQPAAYQEEVENLVFEKEKLATANEAARIAKFRWEAPE